MFRIKPALLFCGEFKNRPTNKQVLFYQCSNIFFLNCNFNIKPAILFFWTSYLIMILDFNRFPWHFQFLNKRSSCIYKKQSMLFNRSLFCNIKVKKLLFSERIMTIRFPSISVFIIFLFSQERPNQCTELVFSSKQIKIKT